jgi:hypothetical protein
MNSTNDIDNFSIGTESQYSGASNNQNGGSNFLSKLFGGGDKGSYATELALRAFSARNTDVGCYAVKDALNNSYDLDYSVKDTGSRTILHHLVLASENPEVKQLLLRVLETSGAKDNINAQDDRLNTPAHCAVYLGMSDVVDLLAKNGADLSIKNKEGYSIGSDAVPKPTTAPTAPSTPIKPSTPIEATAPSILSVLTTPSAPSAPSDIFVKITSKTCATGTESEKHPSSIEDRLGEIVKKFVATPRQVDSDLDFTRGDPTFSDASYVPFSRKRGLPAVSESSVGGSVNSIDVLNMIMDEFRSGAAQKGLQFGGKNGSITGKRRMTTYSEISGGASTSDDDSSSSSSSPVELSELARAVNDKSSIAHDNAVARIKELLGVDEDKARVYKAVIYDSIKKEKPELNNYDRAMELEKRASDADYLAKVSKSSISKMEKIIKERKEMKQTSTSATSVTSESEKKPAKKAKKAVVESSATSESSYDLDTISSM